MGKLLAIRTLLPYPLKLTNMTIPKNTAVNNADKDTADNKADNDADVDADNNVAMQTTDNNTDAM